MNHLPTDISQALTTHLSVTEAFSENYKGLCQIIEKIPFEANKGITDVSLSVLDNPENITKNSIFALACSNNHLEQHQIDYILDEVFSHGENTPPDPDIDAFFKLMDKKPPPIIHLKRSVMSTMRHIGGNAGVAAHIYIHQGEFTKKLTSQNAAEFPAAALPEIITAISKLNAIPERAQEKLQNKLSVKDKLACGNFVCDVMLAMLDEGLIIAQQGHNPKPAISALKALYTTNIESIEALATASQKWQVPALAV